MNKKNTIVEVTNSIVQDVIAGWVLFGMGVISLMEYYRVITERIISGKGDYRARDNHRRNR